MSGVASAIVGGAVVGAAATTYSAKKGAKASDRATQATISAQDRQFEQTREDTAHLRQLSQDSVGTLNRINTGDMSAFYASPDYEFTRDEALRGVTNSAAARGGLLSGRAGIELSRRAGGLASQQYGAFIDRLMQQAGLGNTGIAASASAGMNAANNIGNAYQANAANRANAYAMMGQGVNNAVQGGASNLLLMRYLGTSPGGTAPALTSAGYGTPYGGRLA